MLSFFWLLLTPSSFRQVLFSVFCFSFCLFVCTICFYSQLHCTRTDFIHWPRFIWSNTCCAPYCKSTSNRRSDLCCSHFSLYSIVYLDSCLCLIVCHRSFSISIQYWLWFLWSLCCIFFCRQINCANNNMIELLSFLATRRAKAAKKRTIKKSTVLSKRCMRTHVFIRVYRTSVEKKTKEKKSDVKLSLPGFMWLLMVASRWAHIYCTTNCSHFWRFRVIVNDFLCT